MDHSGRIYQTDIFASPYIPQKNLLFCLFYRFFFLFVNRFSPAKWRHGRLPTVYHYVLTNTDFLISFSTDKNLSNLLLAQLWNQSGAICGPGLPEVMSCTCFYCVFHAFLTPSDELPLFQRASSCFTMKPGDEYRHLSLLFSRIFAFQGPFLRFRPDCEA